MSATYWTFIGLISVMIAFISWHLVRIINLIDSMMDAIEAMQKCGHLYTRETLMHEKRLAELERRIEALENGGKQ